MNEDPEMTDMAFQKKRYGIRFDMIRGGIRNGCRMERNTRNGAGDIGVYAGTWDSGAFEGILLSEGGGFAGCLGYGTGWQRDEAVISGDRKALQNNASAGGTRDPKRGGGVLGTGQSGGV